jgi:hypothetical protein
VVLKAPVPDQIFVAGVNELRKVPVLVQGRDETVRTCGLWAVTKVPGVTIDAYGATSDYEVGHLPVGYPPVRKDILVSVSSTAPVGDGVIELRNKLDTGADTGPLEDLVVGTIGVHIGRPPVLLGHGWRTSQMFSVDTRDRVYSYGTREFGFCPSTYKRVGSWAYSPIGYWLCARDDLAKRRFGVGVVESWVRVLFDAWGGCNTGRGVGGSVEHVSAAHHSSGATVRIRRALGLHAASRTRSAATVPVVIGGLSRGGCHAQACGALGAIGPEFIR